MIGIQWEDGGGIVAVCEEAGPVVIGQAATLQELASMAIARTGNSSCGSAIAVPAWYHDEQRMAVRTQAMEAGLPNPRLVNEPSAAALAYALTKSEFPENCLVLTLMEGRRFDVTVVGLNQQGIEVLSANGDPELDLSLIEQPAALFARIKPLIEQAVSDAGLTAEQMAAIVLAGNTVPLQAIGDLIQSAFGRQPEEPPSPKSAIACGAAAYSRMLDSRGDTAPASSPTPPKPGGGCFGILILVILSTLLPQLLNILK